MAQAVAVVVQHDHEEALVLSGLQGEARVHAEAEVPVAVEVEDGRVISWEEVRIARPHPPTRRPAVAEQAGLMEAVGASREAVDELSVAAALLEEPEVALLEEVARCTCTDHSLRHRIHPELVGELAAVGVLPEVHP